MTTTSLTNPVRRQQAASAALRRFKGVTLRYGTNDCIRMAGLTLRKMGHKVELPKAGEYKTLLGGLKLLRARGFSSIEAALDAMGLRRMTLAYAQPADIIGVPGSDGVTALWVCVGNGRALGWHEVSDQACIIQPTLAEAVVWGAIHG